MNESVTTPVKGLINSSVDLSAGKRSIVCPDCSGDGFRGVSEDACDTCEGSGTVEMTTRIYFR